MNAFGDVWDWASHTYAQLESVVVKIAHTVLPMVPESVLNVGLQVAMTAAGLPPSIPNLGELMNAGSDYLVEQVADQIPVPGANELAGMTVDQFKDKAKDAARQAVAAGVKQAQDAASGKDVKYCENWERLPYIELTVRNTSGTDATDVLVAVGDSANFFRDLGGTIPLLRRGQQMTLPIVIMDRERMNIIVKNETQLASTNEDRAENRWWDDFQSTPTTFTVTVPDGQWCYEGTCTTGRKVAYKSASKVWFQEGASSR